VATVVTCMHCTCFGPLSVCPESLHGYRSDTYSFLGFQNAMSATVDVAEEMGRHRAGVTRYIHYLLRNAAEAEDLAQETFLRAHRQQGCLRDPAALESWLYQIASHVCIDRLRQRARAIRREVDTPVEELPLPDADKPSPFKIVQQAEMSECVQRYVSTLSDSYKAVLLFHDADGLTAEEIAELLQLSLTTVKMRLHRARRQLQAALDNACAFGRDERGVIVCEPKRSDK